MSEVEDDIRYLREVISERDATILKLLQHASELCVYRDKQREEIKRLKGEVEAARKAIESTKVGITEMLNEKVAMRAEIDRLNGWMDLNRQTRDLAMSELAMRVRDLTRERDYLKWAADEHIAALDEDDDEWLAEIYEVEVPNDDDAVSYAPPKAIR